MGNDAAGVGRTLYRLSVVVGSLGVGSMAAVEYGPPPEQLAEMIDAAFGATAAVDPRENALIATSESMPAPNPAEPEPPSWPQVETDANPAGPALGFIPDAPTPAESVDLLVVELESAGASDARIEPWGFGRDRVYRAAATAAGEGGSGPRRLDAFGETPAEASHALVAQIRSRRR